jgi:aspartate/methionine/tyrosine aminotransferase
MSNKISTEPQSTAAAQPAGHSPAATWAVTLFADITERSNDSAAFCTRMLAEVGIAVTPGVDFDHARGNRFLRFSYCGPEVDMHEAAARLKAWR